MTQPPISYRTLPLSTVQMTFNERVGATSVAYGLKPERRMQPSQSRKLGPEHVCYVHPWPEPSRHHPYRHPTQPQ